jgi:hypothetical protein
MTSWSIFSLREPLRGEEYGSTPSVSSARNAVAIELFRFRNCAEEGFGFESPQLHQPVAPDWQDEGGFEKARQFRRFVGRGRVSYGDSTVSRPYESAVSLKVSGRKIPFPAMQFTWVGRDQSFAEKKPTLGSRRCQIGAAEPMRIIERSGSGRHLQTQRRPLIGPSDRKVD